MPKENKVPSPWAVVFRRAREAAGLKQEDVVAAVPGLTQSTYSRWELGQADIEVSVVMKIKEFLDAQPIRYANLYESTELPLYTNLAALLQIGAEEDRRELGSLPPGGKLTEHVAKVLEERAAREEKARAQRDLEAKAQDYDALMKRSETLLASYEELKEKASVLQRAFDRLLAEHNDLQEKFAKSKKVFRSGKGKKRP